MNIGEGGRKTAAAGLKSNERVTIAAFTRALSRHYRSDNVRESVMVGAPCSAINYDSIKRAHPRSNRRAPMLTASTKCAVLNPRPVFRDYP